MSRTLATVFRSPNENNCCFRRGSAARLSVCTSLCPPLGHIQEVYSNANGTVQFVEFYTTGFSELFLTGVQLQLQVSGTPVNSFTFPSDLPGDTTADRTFLAATANFITLYGITPDYIIPPNFLSGGASDPAIIGSPKASEFQ